MRTSRAALARPLRWGTFWLCAALLVSAALETPATGLTTPAAGSRAPLRAAVAQAQPACGIVVTVDTPTPAQPVTGTVDVVGWAADPASAEGTGVASVEFTLDAPADQGGTPLGVARYGFDRPEIATQLGDPRFADSGFRWLFDTAQIPPGDHTLFVSAAGACGVVTASVPVTVQAPPEPTPEPTPSNVVTDSCITMAVELPLPHLAAEPPLFVVGYAYDAKASSGTGVTEVKVYLGPKADGKLLTTPRYGLFRRDLQDQAATAQFANSGFTGTIAPNVLPASGDVTLYVYATGPCGEAVYQLPVSVTASGNQATIATPQITMPTRPAGGFTPPTTPAAGTPVAGATPGTTGTTPSAPTGSSASVFPTTGPSVFPTTPAGAAAPTAPAGTAATAGSLSAPTNLVLAGSSANSVTLNWAASSGPVQNYEIFQSTDGTNYTSLGVVPGTATTLSTLTPGTNYYFTVAARGPNNTVGPKAAALGPVQPGISPTAVAGTTGATLATSGTILPPGNLVFQSQPNSTQGTLSWTPSTTAGVTGYQVYASVAGQAAAAVGGPTAPTATSLTMNNLQLNAQYSFYVTAIVGGQQSGPSQLVGPCTLGQSCLGASAGTLGTGAPTLYATFSANRTVTLTWGQLSGALGYRIYRYQTGGTPAVIATLPAGPMPQYQDVVPATGSYIYYLTAIVNGAESQPSANVTVNVTS